MSGTTTCLEFRRAYGADPQQRDAALARHRLECRGCAEYARSVEALDRGIAQALAVPVPDGLAHRVMLRATTDAAPRAWRRQAYSVAAGLALVAVGVALGVFWQRNGAPLGADVMAHAHHEPQSWEASAVPVAAVRLRGVFDRGEVRLLDAAQLGFVSYARDCPFRGHQVPHLVVQSPAGPAMVLLLAHERVRREQALVEDGMHGVIVPVGVGSIAIVATDPAAVEAVRQRITSAVELGI